jgi:hypothetical protein
MNHHLRNGFRRWPLNDIYHVEDLLKEYDPHLYLLYKAQTNEHLIMDGLLEVAIMKIPQAGFPELTSRVLEHLKKIHVANGFNAAKVMQEHEEKQKRMQEKEQKELAEDLAKETYRATMEEHEFGRRLNTTVGVSK